MKEVYKNMVNCTLCGSNNPGKIDFLCDSCYDQLYVENEEIFMKPINLDHLYAVSSYGGLLKHLIRKFKFHDHRYYAQSFAQLLLNLGMEHDVFSKNQGMIYVPMTKREVEKRGFNQCREIVLEMKKYLPTIPVLELVDKIKETKPQTYLSELDRLENVKGAFQLKGPLPSNVEKILLIDDIYTTGSTLESLAKEIKSKTTVEIIGLVLGH
ncbi:MAG: hypothetical protein Q4Q07_01430 [Tissierellia bacterium]|nr:hypothetical protein [Tissierellia bacterium]